MFDVGRSVFDVQSFHGFGQTVIHTSKYRFQNTELIANEGQHRWKKVQFMSDSDAAGQIWLLTT